MPLSDQEKQRLQDLERQLLEDDPKFARSIGGTTLTTHVSQRAKLGVVAFVLGIGLLVWYFVNPNLVVGIIAFAVMLFGLTFTIQNIKLLGKRQVETFKNQAMQGFVDRFDGRHRGGGDEP